LLFPVTVAAVTAEGEISRADAIGFAEIPMIGRPTLTIAIGNPEVADATVGDDPTIVRTAKAASVENMIVLDETGSRISSAMCVSPTSQSHGERGPVIIRRYKDTWSMREYVCAPQCGLVGARPGVPAPASGIGDCGGSAVSTPSASLKRAAPETNGNGGTPPQC
jgi:hypothetical protein